MSEQDKAVLLQAVKSGDISTAKKLLQQNNGLINCTDSYGNTPLHWAWNINIIRMLISEFKANKDARRLDQNQPIHVAAYSGKEDVVTLLINEFHCEVTVTGFEGQSVLHQACDSGNTSLVRTLIRDCKADINAKNDYNNLPIHTAAVAGREEVVTLLINEFHCEVTVTGFEGQSVLHSACESSNTSLVRTLIRNCKADINARDDDNDLPIHIAAAAGRKAVVTLLINEFRCDITVTGFQGRSVLHSACESSNTSLVRTLIRDCKADINARDDDNDLPIHIAARAGREEVVTPLINEFRCDVTVTGFEGRSVLHRACESSNTSLVLTLIRDCKADINARDDDNNLPIHTAAEAGREEVVTLLINEFHCDVTVTGFEGRSVLHKACESSNTSLVQTLIHDCKADVNARDDSNLTPADFAAKLGKDEMLSFLINEFGCNVMTNAVDAEVVSSPLIVACEHGDIEAALSLLSEESDSNSADSRGRTALIASSENGNHKLTELLLERGASIDSQDHKGCTALMTACENNHIETTSCLLDNDADTYLKNSSGKSAFDIALENNNTAILSQFTKVRRKPSYPGMKFVDGARRETLTFESAAKNIDLDEVGISLSIPENAVSTSESSIQLEVQPCFSGPFDVPPDIELVSPAYIVKPSTEVPFKKEVQVNIRHHANLESEEDCEDMVFLSASTTPTYRGDSLVYKFREIKEEKGFFQSREEQPVGQIALKHFCILALGKRKREDDETESNQENKSKRNKGNLYSARLYKAINKKIIFCVCLYQPQYIQNCNKVMAVQYGTSHKATVCLNGVTITSNEVCVSQTCAEGWNTLFKKMPALILKNEISTQEIFDISDLLEMDYPPKVEIAILSVPSSPDAGPLCLHVKGFDRESTFLLQPDDINVFDSTAPMEVEHSGVTQQVDTSKVKIAVEDLRDEIQEQSTNGTLNSAAILPNAEEMAIIMDAIIHLLQSSDSIACLQKLDLMENKSEKLKQEVNEILSFVKVRCDMDLYVEKTCTFALQIRKIYTANMMHCNTPEWQSAVGIFVTNAANLTKAIKDTLRAAKLAQAIPNNFITSPPPTSQQFPTHFDLEATGHPPLTDASFQSRTAGVSATMQLHSNSATSSSFQWCTSAAGVTGPQAPQIAHPKPKPHLRIVLPPQPSSSHDTGPPTTPKSTPRCRPTLPTSPPQLSSPPATRLPSFAEVIHYLRRLNNVKLCELAGELGLDITDLSRVGGEKLPLELYQRWIREDDDVQRVSGDPSWLSLAKAMRGIQANGLARKIEQDKINL